MVIVIFLTTFFSSYTFANETRVYLIPSSDSLVYKNTIDNIKVALTHPPFSETLISIISLDDFNKAGFSLPKNTDLLVPIGKFAFSSVLNKFKDRSILATLITKLDFFDTLKQKEITQNDKIGAVFIDQPLKRILTFTRLALPNNKRLGFLMSNEYRNVLFNFNSVTKDYSYHLVIHKDHKNLISSLNQVMNDTDVIVALPDPLIFNRRSTHNILLSTYRKLIPLIGFSRSYIKAGALTGIYSTPELIGKQTGELIAQLARENNIVNLPRLDSKYFMISVNNKVARSLGLPPLDEDNLMRKMSSSSNPNND